jgi:hypothetical protein
MNKYYAFIIDLVESRRMNSEDRFDAQEKLHNAIQIANDLFDRKIVKQLSFSAGDSVQGLFSDVKAAYSAYYFIESAIFPHNIRCGIGFSNVNEQMINKFQINDSNAYDGQAYHFARRALEQSKISHQKIVIDSGATFDGIINTLINDDEIVFMTLSRKAIFSLINLINPLIFNDDLFLLGNKYYREVMFFIGEIAKYYRSKSRFSRREETNQISPTELVENVTLEEIEQMLQLNFNSLHRETYDQRPNIELLQVKESTINAEVRDIIVKLIKTSSQNVNALIRGSHMDELRKRQIAKLEIVNYFYGGDNV